tara:strand:- start:1400 stop:1531 length:132 start_codon:yes stop_codon:yes gene_type:complete
MVNPLVKKLEFLKIWILPKKVFLFSQKNGMSDFSVKKWSPTQE